MLWNNCQDCKNETGYTKVICIFDNVVPHEKRTGDRILTKYFVNSIHGAIAMSVTVLDDLKAFRDKIPVKLSPHPLFDNYGAPVDRDNACKLLNLDPGNSYMLFFGFIRAYKGLDLLIEAFSDKRLRNRKTETYCCRRVFTRMILRIKT